MRDLWCWLTKTTRWTLGIIVMLVLRQSVCVIHGSKVPVVPPIERHDACRMEVIIQWQRINTVSPSRSYGGSARVLYISISNMATIGRFVLNDRII
jgi:hypothetical protein